MGKLLDRLNRAADTGPRLGFSMASASITPALFILAALESADKATAQAALQGGAGALLVRQAGSKAKAAVREALGVADNVPLGSQTTKSAPTAGLDFAIVDMDSSLENAGGEQADLVLLLPNDASDALYRLLEGLPVEAFVVAAPTQATIAALLPPYRAAGPTPKPVLAHPPLNASPALLRAIRDAGIAGLVVDVTSETAKQLGELKSSIAALPSRKKKASRARASIGMGMSGLSGGREAAPAEPDEDDDE